MTYNAHRYIIRTVKETNHAAPRGADRRKKAWQNI
nr:MAG TPA: hypothetical protein [Caudoviricetes sp.]